MIILGKFSVVFALLYVSVILFILWAVAKYTRLSYKLYKTKEMYLKLAEEFLGSKLSEFPANKIMLVTLDKKWEVLFLRYFSLIIALGIILSTLLMILLFIYPKFCSSFWIIIKAMMLNFGVVLTSACLVIIYTSKKYCKF